MRPGLHTIVPMIGIFLVAVSGATAATIECSKIGLAYDELFADGNKRVEAVLAEFKALPAKATEQQRDTVRKKFCAVAGELVGLYKFLRALANDCSTQGADMGQLLDVINKQLGMAQEGVSKPCG